jgi:tRNA threonylcarbamoyladenosine biosynthesis protein TsaB
VILGFDTSTAVIAACLVRDDGETFEVEPAPAALLRRAAHSRELMPAIASVMERAGVGFAELDALAVGIGPGSFTGLRIGVATARALAAATGLGLRPVPSLAALAAGLEAPLALPLIDARRGELFAALFERGEQRWPAFAAPPSELAARLREAALSPRAAGDGSIRFRDVLEAAGIDVEPDGSRAHVVRGLHVCRLGAAVAAQPPETVVPEYVRLPDAKPSA